MNQADDPAFPCGPNDVRLRGGLTKREYFAAMAMRGFCDATRNMGLVDLEVAALAVRHADALLAELAKEIK